MSFKKYLKTYFSFSSSERKSLIILLAILLGIFVYPSLISNDNVLVWEQGVKTQKMLDSLLIALTSKSVDKGEDVSSYELFPFDPNQIDSSGMLLLGFSNYMAKNLMAYRKSGGCIDQKADLKRIYGMTDNLYHKLEPYVQIAVQKVSCESKFRSQTKPFDLNKVDSLELLNLGLSRFQIQNILNYRRKYGRFNKKDDLMKIYGIDSLDYQKYEKYFIIELDWKVKESYLFSFNPNNLSRSGWDSLGVGESIVDRLKRFLDKGGRFRKAEDLKKIYGFDSLKYLELYSYVDVPSEKPVPIVKIDLNSADSTQLLTLPGIGPYFSQRIITYRDKLGGFYSINQLGDVYGLKQSRIDSISRFLTIDLSYLRCINVNIATIEGLSLHPYISYREASDILRLRKRKGRILDLESLRKKKIFQDSTFGRVKFYLNLE